MVQILILSCGHTLFSWIIPKVKYSWNEAYPFQNQYHAILGIKWVQRIVSLSNIIYKAIAIAIIIGSKIVCLCYISCSMMQNAKFQGL